MSSWTTTKPNRIGYSIPEAAELIGRPRRVIDEAIARGELEARYPNSRPIITLKALNAWLDALPTESPLRKV